MDCTRRLSSGLGESPRRAHIAGMKVNSPESLETGQRLVQQHGSWSAVRAKSHVTRDGVFAVKTDPKAVDEALKRLEAMQAA